MKRCNEDPNKCPWAKANPGYCSYYEGLEDEDACPRELHNWNDLNEESENK